LLNFARGGGLQVKEQYEVIFEYDDVEVGRHRLDIVVEDTVGSRTQSDQGFRRHTFCYCEILSESNGQEARPFIEFRNSYLGCQKGNL